MVYIFFLISAMMTSMDIDQNSKIIRYNDDEYDAVSAYLIAGSFEGHRFCFIPVFYKSEKGIILKSLGKADIDIEPFLVTDNYWLDKLILAFKDKKILQPYFIVNVDANDEISHSYIQQILQKWQQNAQKLNSFDLQKK